MKISKNSRFGTAMMLMAFIAFASSSFAQGPRPVPGGGPHGPPPPGGGPRPAPQPPRPQPQPPRPQPAPQPPRPVPQPPRPQPQPPRPVPVPPRPQPIPVPGGGPHGPPPPRPYPQPGYPQPGYPRPGYPRPTQPRYPMPYPYPGRIANACVIFHFWDMNPYDQYDRYDFYKVFDGYGNEIATTVNYNDAWYAARYAMQRGNCSFIVNRDVDYDNDGNFCSVDVQSDPWGGIYYRVTNRYGSVIADRLNSYQQAQQIAHQSMQCYQ